LLLRSVTQCQNKFIAVNQNSAYVLLRGGLPGAKENKSVPFDYL
jgi:ribosomal protein L3